MCSGYGIRIRFQADTHKKLGRLNGESGDYRYTPREPAPNFNDTTSLLQAEDIVAVDQNICLQYDSDVLDIDLNPEVDEVAEVLTLGDSVFEMIDHAQNCRDVSNIIGDHIQGWQRYLFEHCRYACNLIWILTPTYTDSDRIASEMVTIDDYNNGWRYLVLQLAQSDTLLRDTVLAASAYHFSATVCQQQFQAEAIYYGALRKLRERQDINEQGIQSRQVVLLSLLILLTSTLVHVSTDFRKIWNLIEKALIASGGEQSLLDGPLGLFLVRQIRKYVF